MTLPSTLHQPLAPSARELLAAFRFVLVAPSHAGNIGAVVRAMRTMGLGDLVIVRPRETDFVNHPQARALASGAYDLLASARTAASLPEAVADCQLVVAVSASPREFGPPPQTPSQVAADALEGLAEGRISKVAMVFGTERTGLLIHEMALCQSMISIPADPEYSSLNLAQAAQIIAFSLRQQVMLSQAQLQSQSQSRSQSRSELPSEAQSQSQSQSRFQVPSPPEASPEGRHRPEPSSEREEPYADHADIERLHAHLEQALVAIGYLDPAEPKRLMPRLRRLFSRTRLEPSEVDLLRGVCRQMEKVAAAGAGKCSNA
jgi:tRNA/rRNA methyltransferase